MDTGSDSSEGEQELPIGAGAPVAMETGVGLKPQMDNIFAEVEKSLPTIDFDLSDVSTWLVLQNHFVQIATDSQGGSFESQRETVNNSHIHKWKHFFCWCFPAGHPNVIVGSDELFLENEVPMLGCSGYSFSFY